ncbi:MAG: M28 family peptidase [Methanobacteriota archaeon]|nr:MAG: M28 family peptidase [Euryarchaeota archaeon]
MKDELRAFVKRFGIDRNPYSNPEGHQTVPKEIAKEWKKFQKVKLIEFDHGGIKGTDLFLPPPQLNRPYYLILAHHDTVPFSPGFDDNLSGMATVTQLVKSYHEGTLKGNIAFALTDFEEGHPRIWEEKKNWEEENGKIMEGTESYFEFQRQFVEKYGGISAFHGCKILIKWMRTAKLLDNLQGVINFESVGYFGTQQPIGNVQLPRDGNYLVAVGDANSQHLLNIFTPPHYLQHRLEPLEFNPDARRSDHALFWNIGVPAVMVTDTANYRNPNYHTPDDKIIDYGVLSQKIRAFMEGFNRIVLPQ